MIFLTISIQVLQVFLLFGNISDAVKIYLSCQYYMYDQATVLFNISLPLTSLYPSPVSHDIPAE